MGRTVCAVSMVLFLTAARISAHHAFTAEYDEKRRVTVSGVVTDFEWTNPHAWLYIDGKDEGGKAIRWSFEMGSPGGLIRRGWRRTELKEGRSSYGGKALARRDGLQHSQRRHCDTAGWPAAIRRFSDYPRCSGQVTGHSRDPASSPGNGALTHASAAGSR